MKANELMIGDWVEYNGKHYQVMGTNKYKYLVSYSCITPTGCMIYNKIVIWDRISLTNIYDFENPFNSHDKNIIAITKIDE